MKTRYTFLQRLLHWLIALMVLGLLLGGLAFWGLEYEGLVSMFGEDITGMMYQYHKTFGILLVLLMLLRIALRRISPPPAYDPPLGGIEKMIGGGIHLLLYLLLIAVPVVGMMATSSAGYPIQFFDLSFQGPLPENKALAHTLFEYHGVGALAIFVLVLVHTAAGLKHWKLKDGIMTRISLP